jgi:hypothetical protein
MKTTLLSILLILGVVSCASNRDPEAKVAKQATETPPSMDPLAQYNNAIDMIKNNPHFQENQKKEMIKLVDDYAVKNTEHKKEEAHLRSELLTNMLNDSDTKTTDATRKKLAEVNKQRTKDLEDFVEKFKFTAGADAGSHKFMMQEMIRTL